MTFLRILAPALALAVPLGVLLIRGGLRIATGEEKGSAPSGAQLGPPGAGAAAPLPGQVIVDPAHPQWFKYSGGGPFFLCGPGDPEGFLYRGVLQSDGTRDGDQVDLIEKLAGTGANSIYLMAVRSHGGDGGPTENPFINSDPTQPLDDDILDQWETWFTAMDNDGIVIFFIFYDDGASIWNTGDSVGAEEKAFLDALVDRFEHHKHLIWVVAEEYTEAFTAARAGNIAAEIRAADDHDHPIAVHKTIGLNFSEFADDPNVDQFAVQLDESSAGAFHNKIVTAWGNAAGRYNLNMAEGHPEVSGAAARARSWAVALGGAYVMHLGWDIATTAVSDLQDCGRLVSFMESTSFNTMAPADSLAYGGTDTVLADPGDSYIAYAANLSGDIGLKGLSAGLYTFRWFDIPTGTTVTETDISLSAGDQTRAKPAGIGSELAVYVQRTGNAAMPGDLNGDNLVDVLDVQLCVNQFLGILPQTPEADVNHDGIVNVLDVQAIVNIFLGV